MCQPARSLIKADKNDIEGSKKVIFEIRSRQVLKIMSIHKHSVSTMCPFIKQ